MRSAVARAEPEIPTRMTFFGELFIWAWFFKFTRLTRGAGPSLAWKPQSAGDQKRILERWDNWIMLVSQKRVLVASWPFMQNCCYCYIFDPRFRPDNVKGFFRAIFLSHDKRLLVKEKNARTSTDRPIARFFDPRDVVSWWFSASLTDTHWISLPWRVWKIRPRPG